MVKKNKNVDGIVAASTPVISAEAGIQTDKTEPLLSIIEPETPLVKEKKSKKTPKKKIEEITETEVQNKPSGFKRHHKIMAAGAIVLGSLLLFTSIIGGGVYAQQAMYENRVFPGVVVWGEDVGGKSMSEVQQLITEKVKAYQVTIKGPDQDYIATTADLGVIYSSDSMALAAYSRGRVSSAPENYLTRARLLATKISWEPWQRLIRSDDLSISPSYVVNEEQFNAYLAKLADNIKITAQDSEVAVAAGQVQLKPAIYGREVKIEELKQQVKSSIAGFSTEEIAVETTTIKPAIIDNAAQEVMVQAQSVMKRPVIFTYMGQEYRPNQETVASWITFVKNTGDTSYTLVVDPGKMKSYFDFLGTKINIYPVSRKIRVENTVKETEIRPGANGTLVDATTLGKTVASQLPVQAAVTVAVPTYVANFKTEYERVIIADWDKYIDINLSTQTMTACEKGGVNCREWKVTTGKDGTSTPTGTFLVLGRRPSFYMTGGTPGVDYYKVWVDRATWFTAAGHAIHDAHWRNGVFGGQDYHWNGSHGCVNSPNDAANYIYDWAAVGTPVIVHY